MKIRNAKARPFVDAKKPFQGANLFATQLGSLYVVYSYGYHWPLFVFDGQQWFENSETYGQATSKHKSQTRPTGVVRTYRTTDELLHMINNRKVA